MNTHLIIKVALVYFAISADVLAYIGPGMAGGALAATIGIVASLFLALFGILYYPIKRSLKRRKSRQEDSDEDDTDSPD